MNNQPLPDADTDLENRFNYHVPTGNKVEQHEVIRLECKNLAYKIKALTPGGREQALAITNLEQVMLWANAAIARN